MTDVNISFSPEAYVLIQAMAARQGKTVSDTLREALSLQQFVLDTRAAGGKILVQYDASLKELIGMG